MTTIDLLGICRTADEIAKGLMFRTSIPENSGMLFEFDTPQFLSFWMSNTLIPLQIAFLGADSSIVDIRRMKPLSTRLICSSVPCVTAIEVEDGTFDRLGIGVGDVVEVDEKGAKLIFRKNDGPGVATDLSCSDPKLARHREMEVDPASKNYVKDSWLQDFFVERQHVNVCFNNYCTMCIQDFNEAMCNALSIQIGIGIPHSNFYMTGMRLDGVEATTLLQGLAKVHPIDEASGSSDDLWHREEEIRYLVLRVWWVLGGEKSELKMERALTGSWAGDVLTRMQAHHKEREAERRAWEKRHDPIAAQLRRKEKMRLKQEQHVKRLVQQKERANEWHADHK